MIHSSPPGDKFHSIVVSHEIRGTINRDDATDNGPAVYENVFFADT